VGEKSNKMVTPNVKLDKRTNIANHINDAMGWLIQAYEQSESYVVKEQIMNAIRWLERTGVSDYTPPSIDNIRIRK